VCVCVCVCVCVHEQKIYVRLVNTSVLVHFGLLKQNTIDLVISNEQKFIWLTVLEAESQMRAREGATLILYKDPTL
jgi:hypothetical protein